MSDKTDLTVVEQKQIKFYDDEIIAIKVDGGQVYVPLRPICDLLGIAWGAQRERIQRDMVLSDVVATVRVTRSIDPITQQRRNRDMLALPLDYLNGWLFGINARRIKKSAVQTQLIRYQKECYKVLADAFANDAVTHRPAPDGIDEILQYGDSPAALAYRHAMAIANLARQQVIMDARIDGNTSRIEGHDARLNAIEAELGNVGRFVTVSQAEQLSQAVRAVGLVFSKATGNNEYGAVYGELYRRFSINSYKRLPSAKFDDAMNWLRQWHGDLANTDDAPF